jgi:ribosome-associated protein
MLRITDTIKIDESEINERFIRSSGPGGQNVNKVATAVQLRFDVGTSPSLSDDVRSRVISLAGNRVTEDGVLVIEARRFRSQDRNRQDAFRRLVDIIHRAAIIPKRRRKTTPTLASKRRRLESKRSRGEIKNLRRPIRNLAE